MPIAADGKRHRFPLAADPRRWKAGETVKLVADITLPRDLAPDELGPAPARLLTVWPVTR